MEIIDAKIIKLSNTNVFIYNNNIVKLYPIFIDENNSLITNILFDDIVIDRLTMDELIIVFTELGFEIPISDIEENIIEKNII